jgi:hypothetical protein
MWFWPVNEMIELVLYLFFLILRTPNMSSRTPGWIPTTLPRQEAFDTHCTGVWVEQRTSQDALERRLSPGIEPQYIGCLTCT